MSQALHIKQEVKSSSWIKCKVYKWSKGPYYNEPIFGLKLVKKSKYFINNT